MRGPDDVPCVSGYYDLDQRNDAGWVSGKFLPCNHIMHPSNPEAFWTCGRVNLSDVRRVNPFGDFVPKQFLPKSEPHSENVLNGFLPLSKFRLLRGVLLRLGRSVGLCSGLAGSHDEQESHDSGNDTAFHALNDANPVKLCKEFFNTGLDEGQAAEQTNN